MKLEQYIALHLAVIVCLSSFLLGMGQGDFVLPIITLICALFSLWAVDFKKLFYIGPVLSNIFILLVLLFSVGYLMQAFDASFGGSLFAVAILRVLVFFQLVLLFRKKENRTCWNIMMVSFLEVIVASVFQQTVLFGLLMILYLFAALTVVTLMHLNRDRNYFVEHVFLRSLFRTSWKGLFARQSVSQLVKHAFATMFSGPLAVIAWFRGPSETVVETSPHVSPESSAIWEVSNSMSVMRKNDRRLSATSSSDRWPLASEKATFSGSTANRGDLIGIDREFYYRLIVGTLVSLGVGLLIFFLTPRQDFRISKLEMQKEDWRRPNAQSLSGVLNTVGFNEEIRLGSLGTVLDNPAEIMYAVFTQPDQEKLSENHTPGSPYTSINNQSVYFRGVVLPDYDRGRWSGGERNRQEVYRNHRHERPPHFDPEDRRHPFGFMWENQEPYVETFRDRVFFPIDHVVHFEKQPAAVIDGQTPEEYRFQPGTQLVEVQCEYIHPSQGIVFSVWPYFLSRFKDSQDFTFFQDRIVSKQSLFDQGDLSAQKLESLKFRFLTFAFRNGRQLELIPCQEPLNIPALLAFDETRLPTVAKVADQWDAPHQDKDAIERAQNLERHFLTDDRYYYSLGGIMRSSTLDPLEDFVRDHPGGHCEYFAGALAMMLRKVGIPSRVVVGYRLDTDIGHKGNNRYVVRQSDAHSWVEAYIAPSDIPESLRNGPHADWWSRGGWLRLDPTAPLREVRAQNGFWGNLKYHTAGFWNDYIVNFNSDRQESAIFSPVASFFASMKDRFFDAEYWQTIGRAVMERYSAIFKEIRKGNWHGGDMLLLGVPLLIAFAICYLIYRLTRLLVREFLNHKRLQEKRQRLVTVEFYRRFERILQRIRLSRAAIETQREFADRASAGLATMLNQTHSIEQSDRHDDVSGDVKFDRLDQLLHTVVEIYYRVRYGDITLTPTEANEINTILQSLEKTVLQCKRVA